MTATVKWTLETALMFIGKLRPRLEAIGLSVGLTGSVLFEGTSTSDLDLIVYPLRSVPPEDPGYGDAKEKRRRLEDILRDMGLELVADRNSVHDRWREKGSNDTKHVEVWRTRENRKVDLFFLK